MARWLVKIEGTAFDLEDYPYWFPHGQVFATDDSDGTYVAGKLLEACNDTAAVYEAAKTVRDEMHAVICLLDPGIRRPTIGVVLREDDAGKRTGTVFASATIGGRSKVRAMLSVNGAAPKLPEVTQAQLLLKAAQTSRHLRIALSLLARGPWGQVFYSCIPLLFCIFKTARLAAQSIHKIRLQGNKYMRKQLLFQ